jgi:hypothetical protein
VNRLRDIAGTATRRHRQLNRSIFCLAVLVNGERGIQFKTAVKIAEHPDLEPVPRERG